MYYYYLFGIILKTGGLFASPATLQYFAKLERNQRNAAHRSSSNYTQWDNDK